jgi:hypothetical protein
MCSLDLLLLGLLLAVPASINQKGLILGMARMFNEQARRLCLVLDVEL